MAEAAAALSLAASILQFIDFSSHLLHRLNDFQSNARDIPRAFIDIKIQLSLLVDSLRKTRKQIRHHHFSARTIEALGPAVVRCSSQVAELESILEKVLPLARDTMLTRALKAFASLAKERRIGRIMGTLRDYVQLLTYYHAAGSDISGVKRLWMMLGWPGVKRLGLNFWLDVLTKTRVSKS